MLIRTEQEQKVLIQSNGYTISRPADPVMSEREGFEIVFLENNFLCPKIAIAVALHSHLLVLYQYLLTQHLPQIFHNYCSFFAINWWQHVPILNYDLTVCLS